MVCVYVGKQDLTGIHIKLDKLLVVTTRLEEHQRSINGSIVELKEESDTRIISCGNHFKELETKYMENKGSIIKFQGIAIGLGVLVTLIGLALGAKSLGLF